MATFERRTSVLEKQSVCGSGRNEICNCRTSRANESAITGCLEALVVEVKPSIRHMFEIAEGLNMFVFLV